MEEKLRLFRLQKNLESASTSQTDMTEEVVDESEEPLLAPKERYEPPPSTVNRKLEMSILALKIVLWCLTMALFVVLEFGAVFFVLSIFYFMYCNFRTTPRKSDEVSAYSVFNPGCQRIEGTLSAEQFERELKYGAASVH
ncbi:SAYSvFN domain-containing protein 1-like isoform X1 [Centruroides sculpturatus]|uniref:SAYSvFN domain-containing protein 1-like isoform X1 n=1 Tax=Centruroides sculpturatus TaxID=218467 RepID=UPI000C6D9532|nr:SAYSvFN domain-containing protein 1-like isoform X1 [Centruroides sculpturatus]